MNLQSAVLGRVPHIQHGFGTLEEPLPGFVQSSWESLKPKWKQVHGVDFADVQTTGQECGNVDALYSAVAGLPVAVVTADCVPVLLAHQAGTRVAAVHAGWRGTRGRILQRLWEQLKRKGEKPSDWVAAIGPSIGPCCYEVSEELAQDFSNEFEAFGKTVVVPRHRILDLPKINALELERIGFREVELIRACTRCSESPRFHSYRREGGGTRQFSVIMRK